MFNRVSESSFQQHARPVLFLVVAGGVGVSLTGTLVVASFVTVIRTWMGASVPSAGAVLVLLISGLVAWGAGVVVPLFALRASERGSLLGRWVLSLVALVEVVALAIPSQFSVLWLVNAVICCAMAAAAVLAWMIPKRPTGATRTPEPMRIKRGRTLRVAQWMLALSGPAGLYSIYLRRAWQAVLALALCALGFVSSPSPTRYLFFAVVMAMICTDFMRLDKLIGIANVDR